MENFNKILFLSDVHYGVHVSSIEWVENINSYFDNFFIPIIKDMLQKGDKPAIFFLGDWYDDKVSVDINVLNSSINTIKKISLLVPIYMMLGNHDIYTKIGNAINSLNVFDNIDNVRIITNRTNMEISGLNFDIIPWTGDIKAETKMVSDSKADIILMHTEIKGCTYDRGKEITIGTDITAFHGKHIFSGHIHKRQENKTITYVGSPYDTSRSDIGNSKGVYILNLNNGTYTTEFIENTYSPKFLKCDITQLYDGKKVINEDILKNNYVDIVCKKSDNKTLGKLMESIENVGFKKVELNYIKENEINKIDNKVTKTMNISDIIIHHINSIDTLNKQDKKYLLDKNKNYFDNINN